MLEGVGGFVEDGEVVGDLREVGIVGTISSERIVVQAEEVVVVRAAEVVTVVEGEEVVDEGVFCELQELDHEEVGFELAVSGVFVAVFEEIA